MKVTKQDVEYTAKLSMLKLDDARKDELSEQLSDILEYAAKIDECDTKDVKPLTHVLENVNALREDEVKPSLSIEEVLQNAPEKEGRTIKVPKLL